ncbi:MAG TPA: tetratricopeptide repeat protein [Pseudomonadota bacterium]|nr:tetratricopeptide repeat protein [Pseudomonadota bacterium]HNK46652.1 tetratricopeptide repeat protein [Pseudomonadota bacterium]HNN53471.1 tetratricopeptide repeat protein [Pseudomonadota bacterium]HNO69262.1 tetratricopeptide repeat protein [Pseudomonadota bacterium]
MDADSKLLAYLTAASELLRDGKLADAGNAIAEALRIAPQDVRALNLLGLLRFQGGQVDEAHAVYARLVSEHPGDPALRLHLGLCELRRGQPAEAVVHLGLVVRSEPDNLRALSYYGLSLLRAGRLVEARPILLRAGQTELVAEVDQKLSTQPPSPETLPDSGPPKKPPRIVEPLVEEPQLPTAPPLADVLSQVTIGEAPALFSLTSDGLLLIRVVGHVLLRGEGVVASVGTLDFVPLGDESSDGSGQVPELLFRAEGRGELLLSPQGGRFTPLSLGDGEELCLAPQALLACSSSLLRDPRVLPRSEGELPCLLLKGPGELVLRSPCELHALPLRPGQSAYLDESSLLGFTAGLLVMRDALSDDENDGHLVCSGHGHVLLSVKHHGP